MKIISLNTWGGVVFEPLMDFIGKQAQTADIFCFQEIYKTNSDIKQHIKIRSNLFEEIQSCLPGHQGFFCQQMSGYDTDGDRAVKVDFDLQFGLAIFLKKDIKFLSSENIVIYKDPLTDLLADDFSNLPTYLQTIDIEIKGKVFTIGNIHGAPEPGSKLDTDRRIDQSNKIINFLKNKNQAKVLVGDFNLLPDTESIRILESLLKNLITEYHIQKTRSNLSPYYRKESFQPFADYTFVSDDVEVESFEVPNMAISDHLPMILQFS